MSIAAASAAGCAFVGSVAQAAVKPIEVAARNPKAVKAGLLGTGAAIVGANILQGDEFDGFDEEEEEDEEQP